MVFILFLVSLYFLRDSYPGGDDSASVSAPQTAFYVVDETTSEKNRKSKKNNG